MLRIYLARHGQDEDNAAGILNGQRDKPLTDRGLEQAGEVAAKIAESNLKFDHIYTSPLRRAKQTAEAIFAALGGPAPEVMADLIERDFGIMTGKPTSSIEETCAPDIIKAEIITYFLSPEGAETFPDLLERADKLLSELNKKHEDGSILLVTHGDIGKMIYCKYYNLNWKDVLTQFHFGNLELLLLAADSPPEEAHVFKIQQHNH